MHHKYYNKHNKKTCSNNPDIKSAVKGIGIGMMEHSIEQIVMG